MTNAHDPKAMHSLAHAMISLAAAMSVGCAVETESAPAQLGPDSSAQGTKQAPVIVGQVNWRETGALPQDDTWRAASRPVALLWLPAQGTRCTAFLVGVDVVMTNQHCVGRASDANGAYVVFDAEAGVPDSLREAVDCSEYIGSDASLDYALLRCQGRPGDRHGVVELSEDEPARGATIHVIHQNCDYYSNGNCAPDKKLSQGRIVGGTSSEFQHDADTLGGSSGAALFDAQGRVVGLHHLGIGGGSNGRGSYNQAVKMSRILPQVRTRFPGAFSPATSGQPSPTPPAADPARDALEPNDDTGSATALSLPHDSAALFIAGGDRDLFRVTLNGGHNLDVGITFDHSAGDLDLYVYRAGESTPVARSEGVTNAENISVALSAGTYFVMVAGYNGATGAYALSAR